MQKNKNGFTLAEILIVLMIVGIIMALSVRAIKIVKASYSSLTYFEFNTIRQIAAEMIAGNSATPLLDEEDPDKEPLKLTSTLKTKKGKIVTIINTDDVVFCRAMVSILNTKGKINCGDLYTASMSKEPYLNVDFSDENSNKPNFSTTNGRRYYITKRTTNSNVSDTYGYRLIAVDLNGKSKPNSAIASVRKPADVVTFLILDNGEVYPLGVAADNLDLPNGGKIQYINSKLKGYNYNSYKVEKDEATQTETIEYAYIEDSTGQRTGGFRKSSAIPSECYMRNFKNEEDTIGTMACDYGVTYLQNENGPKGEQGALSLFSYRQAFCSTLSKPPTYAKYCESIEKHPLCPPADESLCPSKGTTPQDENENEINCDIDLCTVENVKPMFRYDL